MACFGSCLCLFFQTMLAAASGFCNNPNPATTMGWVVALCRGFEARGVRRLYGCFFTIEYFPPTGPVTSQFPFPASVPTNGVASTLADAVLPSPF